VDGQHRPAAEGLTVPDVDRRFMDLDEVANTLSVSRAQVYALVRTGRLRAIKIGGRGVWAVERCALEAFITAVHAATAAGRAGW
jgi:excisionase family DNA binding protein